MVRFHRRHAESADTSGPGTEKFIDPGPQPELMTEAGQQSEHLQLALSRLSPDHKLLLHLRYQEGLSFSRIATLEHLGDAPRARRQVNAALDSLLVQFERLAREQNRQN
jgi:DNA-directed RNA polymerase specialized sigma24 family protein